MVYYLVRLEHHHVTEEFGSVDNDPYDHYIGDLHETTNLRFMIVTKQGLENLCDAFIPDDPFDYESVMIVHEFYYESEMRRFVQCMKQVSVNEIH